jgi:hypothetical protein
MIITLDNLYKGKVEEFGAKADNNLTKPYIERKYYWTGSVEKIMAILALFILTRISLLGCPFSYDY